MNKILIALLVIVIAAAGIFLATSSSDDSDGTDTQASDQAGLEAPAPVEPSQTAEDSEQMFSKDDVALHATETDCWTYVRDSVYDITSYIPRHPGGDEILRACGTDGTSLFESRTTTEGEQVGSGAPHSPDAAVLLADLRIGALAN